MTLRQFILHLASVHLSGYIDLFLEMMHKKSDGGGWGKRLREGGVDVFLACAILLLCHLFMQDFFVGGGGGGERQFILVW